MSLDFLPFDAFTLAAVTVAFLLGGTVKGVVGLGLPTVSIAVLGSILGVREAVALMVVPSLVTNLWQAVAGRHLGGLLRRFWPLLLASLPGVWGGAAILFAVDPDLANAALGISLCLYAALGLAEVRFHLTPQQERRLAPAVGGATGLIAGATGTLVLPAVPYLQASDLDRDALVQAMGLSFSVSTLALGLALLGHGSLSSGQFAASSLGLAPALAGMTLGARLRRRISPRAFRRCLFLSLLVIGGNLIRKGIV